MDYKRDKVTVTLGNYGQCQKVTVEHEGTEIEVYAYKVSVVRGPSDLGHVVIELDADYEEIHDE